MIVSNKQNFLICVLLIEMMLPLDSIAGVSNGYLSVAGIQTNSDLTEDGKYSQSLNGYQLDGAITINDDWQFDASWSNLSGDESFEPAQSVSAENQGWSIGASRNIGQWILSAGWVEATDEGIFSGRLFRQSQSFKNRSLELNGQYLSSGDGLYFIGEFALASLSQESDFREVRLTDTGTQVLTVDGEDSGISLRSAIGAGIDIETDSWLFTSILTVDYAKIVSGDQNLVAYFHSANSDRLSRAVEIDAEQLGAPQLADKNLSISVRATSLSGFSISLDYSRSLGAELRASQLGLSIAQSFGD